MSKRVNICVCVYNRQSIIKSSLDSLLKQTYKDYNILVCDGKSLDKTIDVLLDYQNHFDNLIAWQTEQEGYINTHNFILDKTDSEYICFVDSDDLVDPQKIEEQVKYLDNNPDVDVVSSSVMLADKRVLPNTMIELNNEQITEYLKNGNPMLSVCHFQSCMFRRKCLEKFTNKVYFYPEYENGMCGEGFLYTLHFLGYKFANIISTIYVYTRGLIKNSMSNTKNPEFASAIDSLSYDMKKEYIMELFNAYNTPTKKRGRPKKTT